MNKPNHMLSLLGLVFVILSLVLSVFCFAEYQSAKASAGYQKTTGVITAYNTAEGKQLASVTYEYEVTGKKYSSNNDQYPIAIYPRQAYQVGQSIDVFFDPAKPATACLKQSLDLNTFTGLLIAIAVSMAIGIAYFRLGMSKG